MIDSPHIVVASILLAACTAFVKAPGFPGVFFIFSFALVLLALAFIDSCYLILPNSVLTVLMLLSVLLVISENKNLLHALAGALSVFLTLMLFTILVRQINPQALFGMGDIKLISILTINLGEAVLVVLFLSSVLFVLVQILQKQDAAAFGPYIVICWFIVYLSI